jgi:hypothetical protein
VKYKDGKVGFDERLLSIELSQSSGMCLAMPHPGIRGE